MLFCLVYSLLAMILTLIDSGEAFRFLYITLTSAFYMDEHKEWFDNNVPHWKIYMWFNRTYIIVMLGTLLYIGRRKCQT